MGDSEYKWATLFHYNFKERNNVQNSRVTNADKRPEKENEEK